MDGSVRFNSAFLNQQPRSPRGKNGSCDTVWKRSKTAPHVVDRVPFGSTVPSRPKSHSSGTWQTSRRSLKARSGPKILSKTSPNRKVKKTQIALQFKPKTSSIVDQASKPILGDATDRGINKLLMFALGDDSCNIGDARIEDGGALAFELPPIMFTQFHDMKDAFIDHVDPEEADPTSINRGRRRSVAERLEEAGRLKQERLEQHEAATKIQNRIRGRAARKRTGVIREKKKKKKRKKNQAATKIQARHRGRIGRRRVAQRHEVELKRYNSATVIQSTARSRIARDKMKVRRAEVVEENRIRKLKAVQSIQRALRNLLALRDMLRVRKEARKAKKEAEAKAKALAAENSKKEGESQIFETKCVLNGRPVLIKLYRDAANDQQMHTSILHRQLDPTDPTDRAFLLQAQKNGDLPGEVYGKGADIYATALQNVQYLTEAMGLAEDGSVIEHPEQEKARQARQEDSSVRIQARIRGRQDRKRAAAVKKAEEERLAKIEMERKATTAIQSLHRGREVRRIPRNQRYVEQARAKVQHAIEVLHRLAKRKKAVRVRSFVLFLPFTLWNSHSRSERRINNCIHNNVIQPTFLPT